MNDDKYWPYAKARAALIKRLQATDNEIRMWAYLGHADGGIDLFNYPQDRQNDDPPKRNFTAPEVGSYFLREQIESFTPDDSRRYQTPRALIERWAGYGLPASIAEELVCNLVEDGRLEPINALRGYSAQVIEAVEGALIPDLSLFALDQVCEVEAREFPGARHAVVSATVTTRRDALDAVIKMAKATAPDPENRSSAWETLKEMAQQSPPPPPLLGYSEGEGVKYVDANDNVAWLTRKAFGMRLSDRKKKDRR